MANRKDEFCCMCGSKKDDVDKLIKGRYGYICDSCINIAKGLLEDEEEETVSDNIKSVTPRQIKEHLDQLHDCWQRQYHKAIYDAMARNEGKQLSDYPHQR